MSALSPSFVLLSFDGFGLFRILFLQHGHLSNEFLRYATHLEQYFSFPSLYDEDFTKPWSYLLQTPRHLVPVKIVFLSHLKDLKEHSDDYQIRAILFR